MKTKAERTYKAKKITKFQNLLVARILDENMTFNEASYYLVTAMKAHWSQFEKLHSKRGSMESAKKCAIINHNIKLLLESFDNWSFEPGTRKIQYQYSRRK